jgi:hypothetical protein
MAYIGNTPAESFASFEKQVFTIVNSQTAYTLSHSVVNENDIRLVVNNVVQEPGSGKAYTASGTTLTLSAALVNGTDEMYCVFLGRALQTVNPPNASVGTAQLASEAVTNAKVASSIITGQTAETSIATDDLILLSDTSASGALKKMTRANFVSGVGGTNTPAFYVKSNNTVNVANTTHTQITYDTEVFDTDNAFASNAFTVPSGEGGKYVLYALAGRQGWDSDRFLIYIYKGGSTELSVGESAINTTGYHTTDTFCIADLSAGDVITVQVYHDSGSTRGLSVGQRCVFKGFKLL